jgi:6,7-dimethyl-8-ribityllumazine synthase
MYTIGIVVGAFNPELTDKMRDAALARAKEKKVAVHTIIEVPGSYDMPLATKKLLKMNDVDGVVLLGAIIQGETKHDEVIGNALAIVSSQLSVEFEKPVMLTVSGPGQTREMAESRAEKYGKRGIDAILEMLDTLK